MAESRPKKVTTDENDQNNPLVLQNYTKLAASLKRKAGLVDKVSREITEAKLAALITSLRMAMEVLCGKDTPKPWPITKLPMSLFQDFSVGGSIDTMVTVICQDVGKAGCALLDVFQDDTRSSQLLVAIEKELVKVRAFTAHSLEAFAGKTHSVIFIPLRTGN